MITEGSVSYESNLEDLGAAILQYAEITKKQLPEVLRDQANKLSCSEFSPETRGLFQESAATSPSEEDLLAFPPAVNWHIRRKDGRPVLTEGYALLTYKRGARKGKFRLNKKGQVAHKIIGLEGEMNKRSRARYFQAAGWLSPQLARYASGVAAGTGQRQRAAVVLVLTGSVLSITIVNTSPAALEVAERTGYLKRAIINREVDLNLYIVKLLNQEAANLTRKILPPPH